MKNWIIGLSYSAGAWFLISQKPELLDILGTCVVIYGLFVVIGATKDNPQRNRRSSDHWPEGEKDKDGNDLYEDS